MTPPLTGIRIVEFEGIGPGPLAARMLADMGAEVTVIARPQQGAVAAQPQYGFADCGGHFGGVLIQFV